MILKFTRTQGGVRNVRVIRPGYPADTKEVFHRPFVKAVSLFPVLRFMDWLQSNGTNPFFGDARVRRQRPAQPGVGRDRPAQHEVPHGTADDIKRKIQMFRFRSDEPNQCQ